MFLLGFTMGLVLGSSTVTADRMCLAYGYWRSRAVRKFAGCIIFLTYFILPLSIMVYCYGRITLVLHRKIQVEPYTDKATRTNGKEQVLIFTSRVRGRGHRIGSVCLCVCVCLSVCVHSHDQTV